VILGWGDSSLSLVCPGVVSTDVGTGAALCTDGMGTVLGWTYTPPFDISTLDYAQATEAFAAAFTIVGTCWAIGKGVRLLLDVVRR